MLKFTAESAKGPLFGFGLTDENLAGLIAGRPIQIDLADMGGPAVSILLMHGSNEEALFDDLKAAGLIDPGQTRMDPCNCARCVADRAGGSAPESYVEVEDFRGEVRVDRKTGLESSIGFTDLDPKFAPALAAGFVIGWLRMPANVARLEEALALLSPSLSPGQQVAILKDHLLQFADVIPGARTLAAQGHSLEETDWEMLASVLSELAERRAPEGLPGRELGRKERRP
jgi:hypothetical protein